MTITLRPYQNEAVAAIKKPLSERFWEKVIKGDSGECWIWTGALNEKGYGILGRGRRGMGTERAHRVSWMIHFGPIPKGLFVCHKCDNPQCTNPEHLFLGTVYENNADMLAKGRNVKGECSYSKLSLDQVREIRSRYKPGKITQLALAKEYGVSRSLIGLIVKGERWKDA